MTDAFIQLGLHFGLPFSAYLDDLGLGSGDVRELAKSPSDWWWESRHNPQRPKRKETRDFIVGRALHKLLLEGKSAFDEEFMTAEAAASSIPLTPAEKGAQTKQGKKAASGSGRTYLTADEHKNVNCWAAAVLRNPFLKDAFIGGFYEVSIFWERDGVRLKGRYDCLKVSKRSGFTLAANGDVKTITNTLGKPFDQACRDDIANYGYDAQAAHYIDGLWRIPDIIRENRIYVHGDPVNSTHVPSREWLDLFLADDIRYAWQWFFVQKNGFPVTWSCSMTPGIDDRPGSSIFERGAATVTRGIDNYVHFMDTLGPDKPWEEFKVPEELMGEDMPKWWVGGTR